MQSIIVPPLQGINDNRLIIPESVQNSSAALAVYKDAILEANRIRTSICNNTGFKKYHYYYLLSGTLIDIITTMNARELLHFIQLRSCNRAQWEIRNISIRILNHARANFADLFNHIGPSCFVKGYCPEGKMTCGKQDEVRLYFANKENNDEK
jgi:thymidylate synthase (FAD)